MSVRDAIDGSGSRWRGGIECGASAHRGRRAKKRHNGARYAAAEGLNSTANAEKMRNTSHEEDSGEAGTRGVEEAVEDDDDVRDEADEGLLNECEV